MWPFRNKNVIGIEVRKLPAEEFRDGDVLLVRYPGRWTVKTVEHLQKYLKSVLPSGIRVLALPDDIAIQLLKKSLADGFDRSNRQPLARDN